MKTKIPYITLCMITTFGLVGCGNQPQTPQRDVTVYNTGEDQLNEISNKDTLGGDPLDIQMRWSCTANPQATISKGSIVVLPYVWSHISGGGKTQAKDIEVTLTHDKTLVEAIKLVEQAALAHVQSQGAESLRDYFLESVNQNGNRVVLGCGT